MEKGEIIEKAVAELSKISQEKTDVKSALKLLEIVLERDTLQDAQTLLRQTERLLLGQSLTNGHEGITKEVLDDAVMTLAEQMYRNDYGRALKKADRFTVDTYKGHAKAALHEMAGDA